MQVLIVEDHELLAQSLSASLRAHGIDAGTLPARSPDALLDSAAEAQPELVLLDLDLGAPLGSGQRLVRPLRELGAQVVILTGVTDRITLAECVEAGAHGVVNKAVSFDELLAAVRRAAGGEMLLSSHDREELLADLRRHRAAEQDRLAPFRMLTPREQQVLACLMEGRSAEQIAASWVVSIATVRSQIRSLLSKLGVNSQLSAVALARRAGWSKERV